MIRYKEVKTAVLAIGTILLFIFGYSFLKGNNLLDKHRTFFVTYDNVEGLAAASPVTINGLLVGKVTDIDFLNNKGKLLVSFTIKEPDFKFSKNVRFSSTRCGAGIFWETMSMQDRIRSRLLECSFSSRSANDIACRSEKSLLSRVSAWVG